MQSGKQDYQPDSNAVSVGLATEPPAIAAVRPPPQRKLDLVF